MPTTIPPVYATSNQEVEAVNVIIENEKKLDKIWHYSQRYAGSWDGSSFERICTFRNVIDFPMTFPHFLPVHEMFYPNSPSIIRADGSKSKMDGVCLFRDGVIPDYKFEINGKRTTLSAWSMLIASGSMSFEKLITKVWEITCFAIMGEELDPAECINGAILENRTNSSTNCLNLEIWFSVRSDAICTAILEKLQQIMDKTTVDRFEVRRLVFPKFIKLKYFQTKHKYEKPTDYLGSPFGGLPNTGFPSQIELLEDDDELLNNISKQYPRLKTKNSMESFLIERLKNIRVPKTLEEILAIESFGFKKHDLDGAFKAYKRIAKDDPITKAKEFFMVMLNKLAAENYDDLCIGMFKYPIISHEMLDTIISLVFEKALNDPKYQDIYARLIIDLGCIASEIWSQNYLKISYFSGPSALAGDGFYFDVSGETEIKDMKWDGPFSTEAISKNAALDAINFKSLINAQCQKEFEKIVCLSAEDSEENKKKKERFNNSMCLVAQIFYADETLGIDFINAYIDRLLNSGDFKTMSDIQTKSLCSLLRICGQKIDTIEKSLMDSLMNILQYLSKDKPRLTSFVRCYAMDIIDMRTAEWKDSRSIERSARTLTKAAARDAIIAEEKAARAKLLTSGAVAGGAFNSASRGGGSSGSYNASRGGGGSYNASRGGGGGSYSASRW